MTEKLRAPVSAAAVMVRLVVKLTELVTIVELTVMPVPTFTDVTPLMKFVMHGLASGRVQPSSQVLKALKELQRGQESSDSNPMAAAHTHRSPNISSTGSGPTTPSPGAERTAQ